MNKIPLEKNLFYSGQEILHLVVNLHQPTDFQFHDFSIRFVIRDKNYQVKKENRKEIFLSRNFIGFSYKRS
jgi:hypothetical protein